MTFAIQSPIVRTILRTDPGSTISRLPDGSTMICNDDGRIVQAEYANGAIVSRHDEYCLVQTTGGDYWYRDKHLRWHCLD